MAVLRSICTSLALLCLLVFAPAVRADDPDPNDYYRLSTKWRGPDMPLDVFNGGDKDGMTHLMPKTDATGQFWRFAPLGNGMFKLTTKFKGTDSCLDITNGGPRDNQPVFRPCGSFSGQAWKLVPDGPWVRLKTKFRGDGMCLDIINGGADDGQPQLRACGNFTGQAWRLTRVKDAPNESVANTNTFEKPRHRDNRLDLCWSWSVKDCGQRVADWWCRKHRWMGASNFKPGKADGRTEFIGSNESCNDPGCMGFESITCRDHLPKEQVFANPPGSIQSGDARRLDVCLQYAKNCGAPVAQAFCERKNFRRWVYWEAAPPGEGGGKTITIGSREKCDGGHCAGMNVITCAN